MLALRRRVETIKEVNGALGTISSESLPTGPHREAIRQLVNELATTETQKSSVVENATTRLEALLLRKDIAEKDQERLHVLGMIALHMAQIERANEVLPHYANVAKTLGASWNDIGRVGGITAQAAHVRWEPKSRERHREYQKDRYKPVSSQPKEPGLRRS